MENLEKLRHASSRKVILVENNKVVKFYPSVYGYILHDLAFSFFSLIFFRATPPFSHKRKIINEIKAREILKSFGVKTTKILSFSISERFLEEKFEEKALTFDDLEAQNPKKALVLAKRIGKITRKLNDENFYFIDNRASNWMFNNKLIRTDLELSRKSSKSKKFFAFCDVLSFLSTLRSEKTRESFIKGYGRKMNVSILLQLLVKIYIRLTDIIF